MRGAGYFCDCRAEYAWFGKAGRSCGGALTIGGAGGAVMVATLSVLCILKPECAECGSGRGGCKFAVSFALLSCAASGAELLEDKTGCLSNSLVAGSAVK